MNSSFKKPSQAKNVKQMHRPPAASQAMQPKMAGQPQPSLSKQRKAAPEAPAVYRPQPRTVQPKMAGAPEVKGRTPAAPPVYKPQLTPKVLQLKMRGGGSAPGASKTVSRQPVAPPVFRPQNVPNILQTKKAETKAVAQTKRATTPPPHPPRAPQRQVVSSVRAPVAQAKQGGPVAPPVRLRPSVIQRAVFSKFAIGAEEEIYDREYPEELADRNMEELLAELEEESASSKDKKTAQVKKKKKAPKVDKEAQFKKEQEEKRLAARDREREEEREKELVEQTKLWRSIEIVENSAPFLFGLLENGYATLDAPHRCFLSNYEKNAGVRFNNRFGLSRRIRLNGGLRAKYLELYNAPANDCVVHLHCEGDGSVRSFGIKYLATENIAGNNLVFSAFYLQKAAAYVGDITGANVNAKVGAFT